MAMLFVWNVARCSASRRVARQSRKRNNDLAAKPQGTVITKTIGETIMKEFFEIMRKDIMSENFTRKEYVVYGIIAPLMLVLVCGLAGSLA